jgi:hypothetical protein
MVDQFNFKLHNKLTNQNKIIDLTIENITRSYFILNPTDDYCRELELFQNYSQCYESAFTPYSVIIKAIDNTILAIPQTYYFPLIKFHNGAIIIDEKKTIYYKDVEFVNGSILQSQSLSINFGQFTPDCKDRFRKVLKKNRICNEKDVFLYNQDDEAVGYVTVELGYPTAYMFDGETSPMEWVDVSDTQNIKVGSNTYKFRHPDPEHPCKEVISSLLEAQQ